MNKALFAALVSLALVTGLAFRLARLDARPMHHDEANQAVKFGALLEAGTYRYDASDHHGPTLYYLALPSAWLRGQRTLAALDETTLRLVPAVFGVALILLMLPLARGLGRMEVAFGTVFAAVSPALTYYSRFFIQEMAFACFSLAFLVAAGRYLRKPAAGAALWSGLFAGLAVATKETWLITLPAAVLASVVAAQFTGPDASAQAPAPATKARFLPHAAAAAFVALLVACAFYSSFFTHPAGIGDWLRSFPIYGARGLGDGRHDEPWHYYLHLLAWWRSGGLIFTEALVLALAAAGMVAAFTRGRRLPPEKVFWLRALTVYALASAFVFSAIPYKTPWNLVPFHAVVVLLAGCGAAALVTAARGRLLRAAILVALAAGTWHLGLEAWRANVRYAADPRNPYAYAQTTPDFLRLTGRVADLAAIHPDGAGVLVKVMAGPYEQWPLPWYLRRMTRVGYWTRAEEAAPLENAPILIASQDNAAAIDQTLAERYVSEFYGLRPGVLLTLYVERGLWERFLSTRR
jgi:uncharacterized protein (TIGR03663 family)